METSGKDLTANSNHMDLQTIQSKTPERLSEPEYFQWIDEAVNEAVFTALESELDEVMRWLEAARESGESDEFRQGVGAAIRIIWDRQLHLRKGREG